uniref:Uncharacterized protein n=1 Tax=Opuntia streptacantha TaxID=393608 RepID=A0A7C8YL01_OPUST
MMYTSHISINIVGNITKCMGGISEARLCGFVGNGLSMCNLHLDLPTPRKSETFGSCCCIFLLGFAFAISLSGTCLVAALLCIRSHVINKNLRFSFEEIIDVI